MGRPVLNWGDAWAKAVAAHRKAEPEAERDLNLADPATAAVWRAIQVEIEAQITRQCRLALRKTDPLR